MAPAWTLFSSRSIRATPTLGSRAVSGRICMMPTAPDRAAALLVEPRLLVALGRQQERIEPVALAPLLEQRQKLQEALAVGGVAGAQLLGGHQVAVGDDIAELGALGRGLGERGQRGRELRAVLAERPGDVAAAAQHEVVAQHEPGQCTLPGAGLVVVDHRQRQPAGRHQLQQILVVDRLQHRRSRRPISPSPRSRPSRASRLGQ